ncbi:hypothetical protein ACW9HM_35475, partial [Nocardia gipuzkoensis]
CAALILDRRRAAEAYAANFGQHHRRRIGGKDLRQFGELKYRDERRSRNSNVSKDVSPPQSGEVLRDYLPTSRLRRAEGQPNTLV